jgi:uncharacterized membrane protein YkoI
MRTRHGLLPRLFPLTPAFGLTLALTACSSSPSQEGHGAQRVALAEMTAPARATAERLTSGGKIEKIDKETEDGREIYDVEANVGGKHVEYTIALDGSVLGTETAIEFAALPAPVREAAAKYFGGTTGLESNRVEEDGKILFEIEGKRNGKKAAVTFDAQGTILEEED